jgi:hypothetical protein
MVSTLSAFQDVDISLPFYSTHSHFAYNPNMKCVSAWFHLGAKKIRYNSSDLKCALLEGLGWLIFPVLDRD